MVKRVQATVTGSVHGVGYRYFAVHTAEHLGLSGTVRNTANGVEAIAEGEEGVLEEFLAALGSGPQTATVDDVIAAYGTPTGEYQGFAIVS